MRLANFLPWQKAYAEMLFIRSMARLRRRAFFRSSKTYASRDRRFGGVRKI
jgi:undecaprenyl pyrophosphate synthase